ncbi:MAG: HEAT repeat domain-containing protein [Armatimonadota bacterium]|nr:HEAT repeat domain-containing protein [Armatimonadota bacterium]MDR7436159.1 HEAT repeat domain-containing protein [Armatimonadota bacterium]MDR7472038.1 HEAT repeat domain-containing protein [Armatimonadota bacterium]MDR7507133.1 HEAT repeat domain-containing protein [Armatimonadota bacterium]MDR7509734.1 HEAT repeat domain-containing protein [Armatimonadota bacterium]
MSVSGRAQAAAAVVRRLNAAVKSRRLYAAGHPLRAQTVQALAATLASFHERYGGFVLETHRDGLILEGRPFEGGESIDSLALQLYSAGVWQLILLPGIAEDELHRLLDVVTTDPDAILREGGLAGLLVAHRIERARVVELRPGEDDPAQISLETYHRLLDGSLSAAERAALVGVLRAGPQHAARLLAVLVERTRQAFADTAEGAALGRRVYAALAAVDRLIADTPAAESQQLLQHLAAAVTDLSDPQARDVHRTVLERAAQDLSARALLAAMTSEQIARMVIPCLEEGTPPPQAAQVAQGLPFDPDKARDALALVSQHTGRTLDLPPVPEELRLPPWVRDIPQDLSDYQVSDDSLQVTDEEIAALRKDARVDEDAVLQAHALALARLARAESDVQELEATLAAVDADVAALLERGATDVAAAVVSYLAPVLRAPGRVGDAARTGVRRIVVGMATRLSARELLAWPEDHPLLEAWRALGPGLAADLVRAASGERDPARRQALTAVLVRMGDTAVDALGAALLDRTAAVARAAVLPLAHIRTPRALSALRSATRHPDPVVRREVVAALGPLPGADAQAALLAFLPDPDLDVREACVRHLRPETVRRAVGALADLLMRPDTGTRPHLRLRVIDLLAASGAQEAIPALRRVSSPFRLRRRDREVARAARTALARLRQGGSAARRE